MGVLLFYTGIKKKKLITGRSIFLFVQKSRPNTVFFRSFDEEGVVVSSFCRFPPVLILANTQNHIISILSQFFRNSISDIHV